MQIQINIRDPLWKEFNRLGLNSTDAERITEEAIKKQIEKMRIRKRLMKLMGKGHWEGSLDELRRNRI